MVYRPAGSGSVGALRSSSVLRSWNDFSYSHRRTKGPAQKSDARKIGASTFAVPPLFAASYVPEAKLLSNGGAVARRRSEPVPSLSSAHYHLDLA